MRRIVGDIGQGQARQHVHVQRAQILGDFCAALHVERVVQLIDQADRLADAPCPWRSTSSSGRLFSMRSMQPCAVARCGEDLLEHDLHQPRGTRVRDQSVVAHRAVLGRASLRLHHGSPPLGAERAAAQAGIGLEELGRCVDGSD